MTKSFDALKSDENLNGASALVEVTAMTRIGVLSAGAEITGQRASQIERDAIRLERRGKLDRAVQLRGEAAALFEVKQAMGLQREKEQIRPLKPAKDTALVQGRASKAGKGKAGLLVTLVGADGTVHARTKSRANGAFVLTQDADIKDAQIMVADLDGTNLGISPVPEILRNSGLFIDLPLERLEPAPDAPAPDQEKKMPDLIGQLFEDAARIFDGGFKFSGVELVKVDDRAGKILAQKPEKGKQVQRGVEVTLQVGTGDDARDFRTAMALVRLDPNLAEVGLDQDMLGLAADKLELVTLEALAKVPQMRPARLSQAIPRGGAVMAKAWQTAIKRVLAQFPGR